MISLGLKIYKTEWLCSLTTFILEIYAQPFASYFIIGLEAVCEVFFSYSGRILG